MRGLTGNLSLQNFNSRQRLQPTIRGVRTAVAFRPVSFIQIRRNAHSLGHALEASPKLRAVADKALWRKLGSEVWGSQWLAVTQHVVARFVGLGSGFHSVPSRSMAQQRTSSFLARATIACFFLVFCPFEIRCTTLTAQGL